MSPSHIHADILTDLILCQSCASSPTYWEFMCATILLCLANTGLLLISAFLESYNLPTLSCMMTPEAAGGGV